jgi:hypothetical protein
MRERTGLQRQINEIFGDAGAPIKKRPLCPRTPKPDGETPHTSREAAKKEDRLTSAGAVRPPAPRPLEIPPQREGHETVPRDTLPGSSNVQMLEQRYRSAGGKTFTIKIKKRIKIAIVILLSSFLVWKMVNMTYSSSTGGVKVEKGPTIQTQPVVARLPNTIWPIPKVYPEDVRDPMEWVAEGQTPNSNSNNAVSTPGISRPIVRGILYSEDKPRAIIGTDIVNEGDLIRGALIIKIGRKTVEFEMDGQRWVQEVETVDSKE